MKKYIYLLLATGMVLAVILMSGSMLTGHPVQADVLILKAQSMNNTISASGKLQYREGIAVKVPGTGIIESVAVKNGDQVQKGDLLFSCYKIEEVYTAMLSQYTGVHDTKALIGLLSQYGSPADLLQEVKQYGTLENVCASHNGKITSLKYEQGDIIEKDAVVLKIAEQQQAEVPVNINESQIQQVRIGQKADIVFNALPDRHYNGTVTKIANEADVTNGLSGRETTVEVTLMLDEEDKDLRVGYSAVCSIITSTDEAVLMVPYDAIRTDEEGDYVLVYEQGFARKRPVTVGTEYKDGAAVTEGLSENEILLLNAEMIEPDQKIILPDGRESSDA